MTTTWSSLTRSQTRFQMTSTDSGLSALWHRTGRAARDDRKRLVALYGVLVTPLALVVGALVFRLIDGGDLALGSLRRPIAYVIAPLHDAWMADRDLAALLFFLVEGGALSAVWGLFGGAVSRMAAVHLATDRKEPAPAALAFARRHFRGFAGARAALWASVLLPLAAAILAASAGRLDGIVGAIVFPFAIAVAALLALVAVVGGSLAAVAGFLTSPTIACEDSDAFDAVSRVYGYAAAGLPRLVGVRLLFLCGVLVGSLWRLLRTAAAIFLLGVALEAGAGPAALRRLTDALWNLGNAGPAPSAGTILAASTLALVVGGLVALWLADLVTRVLCARVGAYLALRRAIDRVPITDLRTAGADKGRLDAEAAGFVEVDRVGHDAGPSRHPPGSR